MAKMFYSPAEAAERLGKTEEEIKGFVRDGKLREFRDAGKVHYKVEDVDALVKPDLPELGGSDVQTGSTAGDILLEPADDSNIELSPSGSDIVSLEEGEALDTASGTRTGRQAKEDTVIPSVGVNVFDDDELDEHVDPLAQTAVTDVAGLGMEGTGSGSGILDLTRESDDTSLGAELLEEIYTGEGQEEAAVEMGDSTRAGLAEAEGEAEAPTEAEEPLEEAAEPAPVGQRAVVREVVVEYAPDAFSSALTAAMAVAIAVMWFAGLAAAALVRGITPALLESISANMKICVAGAVAVGVIASGVTYFMAKRSS